MTSLNTFASRSTLDVDGRDDEIFRLDAVPGLERLPYSLKVLAENLLRTEDGANITAEHVRALAAWDPSGSSWWPATRRPWPGTWERCCGPATDWGP